MYFNGGFFFKCTQNLLLRATLPTPNSFNTFPLLSINNQLHSKIFFESNQHNAHYLKKLVNVKKTKHVGISHKAIINACLSISLVVMEIRIVM